MTISTTHPARLTVLPVRRFRPRRYRPWNHGAWSGHLPFINDLIAALKPSVVVELGTYLGESYFGMCQAVEENGVSAQLYAVDTWKGDAHTGPYDEAVFNEVDCYNHANYRSFSKLLRATFDEARHNFSDGTIDLLHIDGLHTYDAVRHDFDAWLPKVRPGGVVMLHDTVARHLDFQVWKLWEELETEFPHLEFSHSWGLGVVGKPGGLAADSEFLEALFFGSGAEQDVLRHYYATQAELLERDATRSSTGATPVKFQLFPHLADGYSERSAVGLTLSAGEWQHVLLELPQGSGSGPIRVDPADRPCLVELNVVFLKRTDGSIIKSWTNAAAMQAFDGFADLARVPASGAAMWLSTGQDPHFLLSDVERAQVDQPILFEAQVRISDDLSPVATVLQSPALDQGLNADVRNLQAERDAALARDQQLTADVRNLQAERDAAMARSHQLSAEIRNLQAERVAAVAEYRRVHALRDSDVSHADHLRRRLAAEEAQVSALRSELSLLYGSRSWRLTKPLRAFLRAIR